MKINEEQITVQDIGNWAKEIGVENKTPCDWNSAVCTFIDQNPNLGKTISELAAQCRLQYPQKPYSSIWDELFVVSMLMLESQRKEVPNEDPNKASLNFHTKTSRNIVEKMEHRLARTDRDVDESLWQKNFGVNELAKLFAKQERRTKEYRNRRVFTGIDGPEMITTDFFPQAHTIDADFRAGCLRFLKTNDDFRNFLEQFTCHAIPSVRQYGVQMCDIFINSANIAEKHYESTHQNTFSKLTNLAKYFGAKCFGLGVQNNVDK